MRKRERAQPRIQPRKWCEQPNEPRPAFGAPSRVCPRGQKQLPDRATRHAAQSRDANPG